MINTLIQRLLCIARTLQVHEMLFTASQYSAFSQLRLLLNRASPAEKTLERAPLAEADPVMRAGSSGGQQE
jgi:hypothetical protein